VEQFAAEDLVTHDRYGLGRVISTEADTVVVDFGAERHRIAAPYTKLTKL
jgi:DNA helicase-2/ATP-dependent DNA helicase PcrA